MSIILPAAPANFYAPTLNTLKNDLLANNGSTTGQVTLLTGTPDDINNCWAEVGAGGDATKGSLVAGKGTIPLIIGPTAATFEGTSEFGYKLEFAKIPSITIDIGTGNSILLVGFALIIGRDTFSQGTNDDVRYIAKLEEAIVVSTIQNTRRVIAFGDTIDIQVDDGDVIELPEWNLIINYAEPVT